MYEDGTEEPATPKKALTCPWPTEWSVWAGGFLRGRPRPPAASTEKPPFARAGGGASSVGGTSQRETRTLGCADTAARSDVLASRKAPLETGLDAEDMSSCTHTPHQVR